MVALQGKNYSQICYYLVFSALVGIYGCQPSVVAHYGPVLVENVTIVNDTQEQIDWYLNGRFWRKLPRGRSIHVIPPGDYLMEAVGVRKFQRQVMLPVGGNVYWHLYEPPFLVLQVKVATAYQLFINNAHYKNIRADEIAQKNLRIPVSLGLVGFKLLRVDKQIFYTFHREFKPGDIVYWQIDE